MNPLSAHAAQAIAQLKLPFSAVLPSLLYEQDREFPSFVRFKESRAVRLRKEYGVQLRTDGFCALARCVCPFVLLHMRAHNLMCSVLGFRCMDHFTSRAHHSVFLFVAEERQDSDASGAWCVRAFRLTRALELQEETDVALVSSAWAEFQSSDRALHAVDHSECLTDEEASAHADRACRKGRCDLRTCVSVQSWGTVAHYATTTTGCDEDDRLSSHLTSLYMPWLGCTQGGRMVHRSACNVFAGCVDVPLLIPKSEIFDGARHRRRRRRASASEAPLLDSVRMSPVMPAGWFRNALIGARMHSIEMYRGKSLLVCETLDGRVFRFRERFPDMPLSREERKGGESEEAHDDVVPTPSVMLARLARWRDELAAHQHNLELPC